MGLGGCLLEVHILKCALGMYNCVCICVYMSSHIHTLGHLKDGCRGCQCENVKVIICQLGRIKINCIASSNNNPLISSKLWTLNLNPWRQAAGVSTKLEGKGQQEAGCAVGRAVGRRSQERFCFQILCPCQPEPLELRCSAPGAAEMSWSVLFAFWKLWLELLSCFQ